MRKKEIILFSILVLLAGCSKDAGQSATVPVDDAWKYDESLPVPIFFSAPEVGVESKALVEGSVMRNLDVGITALATEYIEDSGTGSNYVPAWSGNNVDKTVLLYNTKVTTGNDGEITFNPAVYYPMDNQYEYSFYAYYPHHAVRIEDGWCKADFTLGSDDILWAESYAEPINTSDGKVYGYNAAYIRAGGVPPTLSFTHKLTALKFTARFETDEFFIKNFAITGIQKDGEEKENIPTNVSLKIAGTEEADPDCSGAGTFEILERSDAGIHAFSPEGTWDLSVDNDNPEIGTLLILPVEPDETLYIEVSLHEKKVGGYSTRCILPVHYEKGFEAGKIYEFTVTVRSREDIDVIPTHLNDWQDGFATGE